MRFVNVVLLTAIATCALIALVVGTCTATVQQPPKWVASLGAYALLGSPVLGLIAGLLVWGVRRKSGP